MIALAVSDFDLPRRLLAAGQIEVDYLETGGHFDDYALLEWVLQRTKPLALTLEYHREEAELRAELERLRTMLELHSE